MDPEEVKKQVAEGRANGYTDAEIKATLAGAGVDWTPEFHAPMALPAGAAPAKAEPQPMYAGAALLKGAIDAGPSAIQGATLNTAGLVSPEMKALADKYGADHPILGPLATLTGAVGATAGAGALLPGALIPTLGMRALAGGLSGGIASAAAGDGTLAQRAKRGAVGAAVGAGVGAVAPAAVGFVGRKIGNVLKPRLAPGRAVADAVGPLLPDDAAALMARQEQLAPGAAVPAGLSPDIPASTRVIGANAKVARQAQTEATERLQRIGTSINEVGDKYNTLLADRYAPLDLEKVSIQGTITKHGMMPADEIALSDVQKLRSRLRIKRETAKGMVRHELGQDIKKLSDWLEAEVPEIGALDRDYSDLLRMRKSSEEVIKNLRQSRKAYASSRAAGIEPGSPGAALPNRNTLLGGLVAPDRSRLASEAYRLLLQPGQIPKELLKARNRVPYQPGLLGPIGVGAATPRLTGSLFE